MAISTHEVPQTYTEFVHMAVRRRLLTPESISLPKPQDRVGWGASRVVYCYPTEFNMPEPDTLKATITTFKQPVGGLVAVAVGTQDKIITARLIPIPRLRRGEDPSLEVAVSTKLSLPQGFSGEELAAYLPNADSIGRCLEGPAAINLVRESIRTLGEVSIPDWEELLASQYREIPEPTKTAMRSTIEGLKSKRATKLRW